MASIGVRSSIVTDCTTSIVTTTFSPSESMPVDVKPSLVPSSSPLPSSGHGASQPGCGDSGSGGTGIASASPVEGAALHSRHHLPQQHSLHGEELLEDDEDDEDDENSNGDDLDYGDDDEEGGQSGGPPATSSPRTTSVNSSKQGSMGTPFSYAGGHMKTELHTSGTAGGSGLSESNLQDPSSEDYRNASGLGLLLGNMSQGSHQSSSLNASNILRTRRRKAGIADEEKMCVVCGEFASGYNFDRLTCESCKAFFRRNAVKSRDKIKPCTRDGQCEIVGSQRKHCPSCRLEKCLREGMKKELILPPEKLETRAKPKRRQSHMQQTRDGSGMSVSVDNKDSMSFSSPPLKMAAMGSGMVPQSLPGAFPSSTSSANSSAPANYSTNFKSSQKGSLQQQQPPSQQQQVPTQQQLQQQSPIVVLNGLRGAGQPPLGHPSLPPQFQLLSHPGMSHPSAMVLQSGKRPPMHMLPMGPGQSPVYRPHHPGVEWPPGIGGLPTSMQPYLISPGTEVSSYLQAAGVGAPTYDNRIPGGVPFSLPAGMKHPSTLTSFAMAGSAAEQKKLASQFLPISEALQPATRNTMPTLKLPTLSIAEMTRAVQFKLAEWIKMASKKMGAPTDTTLSQGCNGRTPYTEESDLVQPPSNVPMGPLYSLWSESVSSLRHHFQQGGVGTLLAASENNAHTAGTVSLTREQLCNRMESIITCITNLAKGVPGFREMPFEHQADLLKRNIFGLILIVCSFLQDKESLLSDLSRMEANNPLLAHSSTLSTDTQTLQQVQETQQILYTHRQKLLSITRELEVGFLNDDYLRVAVFALRLFSVESLPESMRSQVQPLHLAVLRFIRRHLVTVHNDNAGSSSSGASKYPSTTAPAPAPAPTQTGVGGSSTAAYVRILLALSHCRPHEARLRAFTEFLKSDHLIPLMRDVFQK